MTINRIPLGLNLGLWDRMTSWDEVIKIVQCAEQLGYHNVCLPESFARDGFTLCDRLLAATDTIQVCIALANVFSRSPAVLAQTAATMDELSNGRFILGLGSSTPNLVEGWHGMSFAKPLQRTRETIAMCRRIWRRDKELFDGDIFRAQGVKLGFEPIRDNIPIWHGALLEKSLTLCGEMADGWIPNLLPVEGISIGKQRLQAAALQAGRAENAVQVVPGMQLLVGENTDELLQLLKFGIAVYYGPATSPYAKAAAALGYAQDVAKVQDAYASGGSNEAIKATSDALAQSVAIVGPVERCRERLEALLAQGADIISITLPASTLVDCEPILKGLIPHQA